MKKLFIAALCAISMFAVSSCSLFSSDVSNIDVQFGWAESTGAQDINGYPCVGVMWTYCEAFQTTFEPISSYHSWTTAGGSCYTEPKESRTAEKYIKKYADQAIKLAESNAKAAGETLPSGETFRVVYTYGASKKVTKVLDYPVK